MKSKFNFIQIFYNENQTHPNQCSRLVNRICLNFCKDKIKRNHWVNLYINLNETELNGERYQGRRDHPGPGDFCYPPNRRYICTSVITIIILQKKKIQYHDCCILIYIYNLPVCFWMVLRVGTNWEWRLEGLLASKLGIGDARLIPASFDFEIRCSSLTTSAPCCKHAQTESKCSNFYPSRYMD